MIGACAMAINSAQAMDEKELKKTSDIKTESAQTEQQKILDTQLSKIEGKFIYVTRLFADKNATASFMTAFNLPWDFFSDVQGYSGAVRKILKKKISKQSRETDQFKNFNEFWDCAFYLLQDSRLYRNKNNIEELKKFKYVNMKMVEYLEDRARK